jgi:hypothetical protein
VLTFRRYSEPFPVHTSVLEDLVLEISLHRKERHPQAGSVLLVSNSNPLRGRAMKLHSLLFRSSLLPFAMITMLIAMLLIGAERTAAQSAAQSQASAAQAPATPARITQAIDETQLVRLKGNVHPLARPEFDQGPVADSTPMNRMLLVLQRSPEQQAALAQLMEGQLTKGSPNYHNWLTPQQFGAQFGPAAADIQAVTDWLTRQGFQKISVGAGRTVIEFSGNVGQVRNAFHTEMHRFLVNGEARQANTADPQIPAALTPVVAGIVTLHDFPRTSMKRNAGAFVRTKDGIVRSLFTAPTNCGTTGNPACNYVVGPADFAKIYNLPPTTTLDGTGVTIALVADSNINPQDVANFRSLFGLSANFTSANIILDGPDPGISGPNGDEGEADLDTQVSGMVAPGATINLVVSESTLTANGIDLSALYIIDNNIASVMSESFGVCEPALGTAGNQFYNALWEQAAAQGISAMVSAGDNGSAGCDDFSTQKTATRGLAVSGIASTPFNVAVGGTDFDDAGKQTSFWNPSTGNAAGTRESALGYIPEIPWNDSCAGTATSSTLNTVCASANGIAAGSGGPSTCATTNSTTGACISGYPKPAWQTGFGDTVRDIPDVSLFASPGALSNSFYPLCESDVTVPAGNPPICAPDATGHFIFFGAGGTSASSPAFAGIMALINQQQGGRQGNPNPVLYSIAKAETFSSCNSSNMPPTGSASCVFYDITNTVTKSNTNNSVPCTPTTGVPNCSATTSGTTGVLVSPSSATTPAWTSGTGYDMATGLGSVNVTNLAAQWALAAAAFKSTSTTLQLNGGAAVNITHGQTVTATSTVASVSGTPTGDVSLLAPTTANGGIGNAPLSSGTVTVNNIILPGGSYSVHAHYAGDGTFAPSDSNLVPVTVTKENSKLQIGIVTQDPATGNILSTNATSLAYGSPYVLRMDILNSKGTTGTGGNCQPLANSSNPPSSGCAFDATGTVMVTDGTTPLDAGTFPINSLGNAEDQPIQLAPGSHPLSASYSGDLSYNASGPVTDALTVTKATTVTQVVPNPSAITMATSVTLTATIRTQSNGAAPTGTVQFLNGSTPISGTVTYSGQSGAQSSMGFATLTATLTTTLSALPVSPAPRAPLPVAPLVLLLCVSMLLAYLTLRLSRSRRRGFVYASVILLAGLAAVITGCGSSGGSSGSHTISINAQYSGDTNYAASTGSTIVTK